ncbi:MAG: class I adenylate-forming enzyme family protein [Variovorax sp.]
MQAQLAATTSVNALLDGWAERAGSRIAVDMPSIEGGRLRWTYVQLRDATCRVASGLHALGLRSGDRIAILAEGAAYAQCVIAYLALLRMGCVMVPVNPRYVDEEIDHALRLTGCAGIIASPKFAARVDGTSYARALSFRIGMCDEVLPGWVGWPAPGPAAPCREFPDANHDTPANIIFTSGTTGKPKGVMHTHGTALACGAIYSSALTLVAGDVYHHPIPFCTSSGTQFTLMAALWAGATLVTEPEFKAPDVLARMREIATTVFLGVPSHLLFLLDELKRSGGADLPALRVWNYGGAVMPREAIETLRASFPNVEQRQNYGMTETGPTGALLGPEDIDARSGSTGRPMPLCEIRIVDEEGVTTSVGGVGEICVRSPACMKGYYGNAAATQETLDDGWVKTGDVGYLDEDGFLYYTDRRKDIINRGGLKVGSIEIEEVLYRSDQILEAAVIAVPHPRLGEDIAAFVVPRPGAVFDRPALDRLLQGALASFKVPRTIHVVVALPRNAMGKVLKAELRRQVADGEFPGEAGAGR